MVQKPRLSLEFAAGGSVRAPVDALVGAQRGEARLADSLEKRGFANAGKTPNARWRRVSLEAIETCASTQERVVLRGTTTFSLSVDETGGGRCVSIATRDVSPS